MRSVRFWLVFAAIYLVLVVFMDSVLWPGSESATSTSVGIEAAARLGAAVVAWLLANVIVRSRGRWGGRK